MSSARRNEDDGYQIEAVVSAMRMARPRSAAYLLEEATALWREPTVILQ